MVPIKQGAYLVIESTEALNVVDVNSGIRAKTNDQEENTYEVNRYAAEEIARQLRLRDMGGIVIVDFIDMENQEHKNGLFKYMTELMQDDRAKHNVLPLTKFGLMQITRQRIRPVTEINTTEVCPVCHGTGRLLRVLLSMRTLSARFPSTQQRTMSSLSFSRQDQFWALIFPGDSILSSGSGEESTSARSSTRSPGLQRFAV